MKGFILGLGVILVSTQVWAARWIVEGASQLPINNSDYKIIKEFNVGSKNYLVIETIGAMSTGTLKVQSSVNMMFSARKTIQDIRIELVQAPDETMIDKATSGWHSQRLHYDQLDPNYEGQNVIVAVLDTGVDIKHPQLASKIWTNPNEIPGNGIDDDGNGYIDDVNGWNFPDKISSVKDTEGHGTHCAGIIAADSNPIRGDHGVAPRATIMPLKIISDDGENFLSDAAEAIVYATNNGAQILSNSWRIYNSWATDGNQQALQMLAGAIQYAGQRGVLFVAAAGNEHKNLDQSNAQDPIFPLSFQNLPTMIGVASGDSDNFQDVISSFSNHGRNFVQLAAPGSVIFSTVPNGNWEDMSGTSMATPLVAGALARIASKGHSPFVAYQILAATVDQSVQSTWEKYVAYGYINIYEAMKY